MCRIDTRTGSARKVAQIHVLFPQKMIGTLGAFQISTAQENKRVSDDDLKMINKRHAQNSSIVFPHEKDGLQMTNTVINHTKRTSKPRNGFT